MTDTSRTSGWDASSESNQSALCVVHRGLDERNEPCSIAKLDAFYTNKPKPISTKPTPPNNTCMYNTNTHLTTRNNNILTPILHSNIPIRMHNRQIPTMKIPPLKRLPRSLRIPKILLHSDIPVHHNLTYCLPISGYVYQLGCRGGGWVGVVFGLVDYADGVGGEETEPLAGEVAGAFGEGVGG